MVFSSLLFLFAYLPLTLLVYYLSPRRWKNSVLLLMSLVFYAWGEPVYLFLMLFSIASAFFFGIWIGKYRKTAPNRAKKLLIASLAVSLSLLFFFKYYNFFAGNLSRILGVALPEFSGLRLPIGISFYTFQIMSYSIDVYRGDCAVQKNPVAFGTYVTLFPQLIAGPIVRYREIDRQLTDRRESLDGFADGISRFLAGLAKKVLLGDLLAAGWVYFRDLSATVPTVLGAWMAILLYTLHLYFDFSGYSDMAIGLGKLFGFDFPENFRYPYLAVSITDFWRRWHLTLSSWFREYVYIPLGGNRRGKRIQYRNLAVVWLLTGLWHGASWNFLAWGAYFAVILIAEKAFLLRALEKIPRAFCHLYACLLILFGFLIFSAPDLPAAWNGFRQLFGFGCVGFSHPVVSYQTVRLLPLIAVSAVGATPFPKRLFARLFGGKRGSVLVPVLSVCVFFLCVSYLVDSTFSPFEYLQF